MAAQSTALTEFADNGNSRTYTTAGTTTSKPKYVISSRRVPSGNQTIAEYSFRVSHATVDADTLVIPEKVSFSAIVRFPTQGATADRDAALVIFRDIVAGDEFGVSVGTLNHLV